MIDPDIRAIIEPELAPGEEILWADTARRFPGRYFAIYEVVICIGAAIFLVNYQTSTFAKVMAGLMFFFGLRSLKSLLTPRGEKYVLTDKRVFIIRTGRDTKIESSEHVNLHDVGAQSEKPIGTVHLYYDRPKKDLFLYNIDDPKNVERIIKPFTMIDPDIRAIIEPELMDGEELVWAEQPQKHSYILLFSGFAFFLIFSFLFFVPSLIAVLFNDPSYMIFDINGVPANSMSDFSRLILPMIFIGITTILYCWHCYYLSKRIGFSTYAVSNTHAFIKRPNRPYKTLKLALPDYALTLNGNSKKGSIFFKKKTMSPILKTFAPTGSFIHPVFFKIENPKSVHDLMLTKAKTS